VVCSIAVFRLALEGPRAKMVGFEPPQARRKLVRDRAKLAQIKATSVAVRVPESRCGERTRCSSNGVIALVSHAWAMLFAPAARSFQGSGLAANWARALTYIAKFYVCLALPTQW
jgi:hypothetical protein